ncbi:MAG: YlbF family regulator [Streptococcaceae bacterium]|jgi:cell fate (sporulation/competence/biofilm development) regulator YmcA (YheA/YmcA/DUF963 family)|nr:YlbF family regulator [Streptococcaceae bacterium]
MEKTIEKELSQLLKLLEKNPNIIEFHEMQKDEFELSKVNEWENDIKEKNKTSVHFGSIGFEEVKEKIQVGTNELYKEFEDVPFVKEYRERLYNANELLSELIKEIERGINNGGEN